MSNAINCGGCGVECKNKEKCIAAICEMTSLCENEEQTLCNGTCIIIGKNNVEACNDDNESNPFACAQGYAHLDSILTNGCETKLSDVHIAQTERDKTGAIVSITCENGYADLDDKLTNGCETKLSDIHVVQTELNEKGTVVSITCENGYGNLDEKLTNGCETKLSDVHVEKVTKTETGEVSIECAKGYKNCDNLIVTGCEINITNNNDHCGECNQPCPSGSRDNMVTAECKNSICKVYCASNYKSNSSGECEFDPSYTCCGYEFDNTCKNCTIHIPGSIKGTCTYDKEKGLQECSVSKGDCNVGYGYSEEEAKCVPSECLSDEDCKEESGKSGANLCDKYTGKCRCGDLATPCSGKKQFCKETDKDTVCIECIDNDDCPVSDGVKTVICDNNACSIKECQLGYHFSDNQCVVDDESNCYGKGKCPEEFPFCSREKQGCVGCVKNADCESLQDKNNAKNMVCNTETNTCKVPENGCKDGYGYYEEICYKLKKSNKDHVGTVINIGNKEIVYSCTDGYLPNDDKTECNVTCSVNENCASTTDGYHKCKHIKIKHSYKYLCACGDTSTVCSPNQTCNPTDKRDSDKFEQWTYECLNPAIN